MRMKKILLGCLIIGIGFIFYQGTRSSGMSTQISNNIVYQIVDVVEKVSLQSQDELYYTVHVIVRKSAHFFEYAVLGGLLAVYFNRDVFYSLFGVLLCATLDEYFQSFIGRTSAVEDILIDFCGGIVGIIIIHSLKKGINRAD